MKIVGMFLIGLAIAFLSAIIGGTVLWLIWPVAIPAVFPKVVEQGVLAAKLTWWQAVLFTWIATILLKPNTNSKEDK